MTDEHPKIETPVKRGVGRPPDYKPEYVKQAYKLCAVLDATDADLAIFFEKDVSTISRWKIEHPEFQEALKRGKLKSDAKVSRSLKHRANGYSHPETKVFLYKGEVKTVTVIKHYPPDTLAGIFWLQNRQPDKYRKKIGESANENAPDGFEVIEYDDED